LQSYAHFRPTTTQNYQSKPSMWLSAYLIQ